MNDIATEDQHQQKNQHYEAGICLWISSINHKWIEKHLFTVWFEMVLNIGLFGNCNDRKISSICGDIFSNISLSF